MLRRKKTASVLSSTYWSFVNRLWFRRRQDFLKTRIATQCIQCPSLAQMSKRHAAIGIIDREGRGEKTLDQLDSVIGIAGARINQREKRLHGPSVDHVLGNRRQFVSTLAFAQRVIFASHQRVKKTKLRISYAVFCLQQCTSAHVRLHR